MIKACIISNGNVSVLGVHLGMNKNSALTLLKEANLYINDKESLIVVNGFEEAIYFRFNNDEIIDYISLSIAYNKDHTVVNEFKEYHSKIFRENRHYSSLDKKENRKDSGETNIIETYKSKYVHIKTIICKNVQCLDNGDGMLVEINCLVQKDDSLNELGSKEISSRLFEYTILSKEQNIKKRIFNVSLMSADNFRVACICITVVFISLVYAYSHRYTTAFEGKAIVDKWNGTMREVKMEQ